MVLFAGPLSTATGSPIAATYASQEPFPSDALLYAVAASSPDDVWAVGSLGPSLRSSTLAEHWDGTAWTAVPTPSFGIRSSLDAVTVLSAANAWAVGSYTLHSPRIPKKLLLHWDGNSWQRAPVGRSSHDGRALAGIAALSPTDIWVVGERTNSQLVQRPLTLHFDGTRWTVIHVPAPSTGRLSSVSAASPTDVWAVGSYTRDGSETPAPLIEHWDGTSWSQVATEDQDANDLLTSVTAISQAAGWAVGIRDPGSDPEALIEHWDGTSWQPQIEVPTSQFASVAAYSATDAWAVGEQTDGPTSYDLFEHWDGSSWTQVYGADPGPAVPGPQGVVDIGPGDAWAVGIYDAYHGSAAEHWDGHDWSLWQ
jgi:hypothetical protein